MAGDSKWSLPRLLGLTGAREQTRRQRVVSLSAGTVFGVVAVLVGHWLS